MLKLDVHAYRKLHTASIYKEYLFSERHSYSLLLTGKLRKHGSDEGTVGWIEN